MNNENQINLFDEINWQIAEQCIYGLEDICRFAPCKLAQEVKCCRECPYSCCAKCEYWRKNDKIKDRG